MDDGELEVEDFQVQLVANVIDSMQAEELFASVNTELSGLLLTIARAIIKK